MAGDMGGAHWRAVRMVGQVTGAQWACPCWAWATTWAMHACRMPKRVCSRTEGLRLRWLESRRSGFLREEATPAS
jgi:hypothetical protein